MTTTTCKSHVFFDGHGKIHASLFISLGRVSSIVDVIQTFIDAGNLFLLK